MDQPLRPSSPSTRVRARLALNHLVARIWARRHGISFDGDPYFDGGLHLPAVDNGGGRISLGRAVQFVSSGTPVRLGVGRDGVLRIGDRSFLNTGVNVFAATRVDIGARVRIADFVSILDTNFHEIEAGAGVRTEPVSIGDNAWIGHGAIVLPGVSIGAGTVVAAGSVVVSSLPPGVLAAGNPAEVKRALEIPEGWTRA